MKEKDELTDSYPVTYDLSDSYRQRHNLQPNSHLTPPVGRIHGLRSPIASQLRQHRRPSSLLRLGEICAG